MVSMKSIVAALLILSLLAGAGAVQAALMEKLLPGRWMMYAGGGADTWDFHADGTCTGTWYSGETETHTWRVEPAGAEDREKIWANPRVVLVIDGARREGVSFDTQDTIALMQGGIISQAERDLAAPLPLCMNITHDIGGGGYVRMKGE